MKPQTPQDIFGARPALAGHAKTTLVELAKSPESVSDMLDEMGAMDRLALCRAICDVMQTEDAETVRTCTATLLAALLTLMAAYSRELTLLAFERGRNGGELAEICPFAAGSPLELAWNEGREEAQEAS